MIGTACTFIPNNRAPDGLVARALAGLQSLRLEMAENSGINDAFTGRWGTCLWWALQEHQVPSKLTWRSSMNPWTQTRIHQRGPELIRLDGWEHVPNFWYGRVDDWTPGGGSHVIVLVTSTCEQRPWQERDEHWTHKRQHLMTANRSNDYNNVQNPKHTYSAPIQEDHLNHSKSMHIWMDFFNLKFMSLIFVVFTFNACWKCNTLHHT